MNFGVESLLVIPLSIIHSPLRTVSGYGRYIALRVFSGDQEKNVFYDKNGRRRPCGSLALVQSGTWRSQIVFASSFVLQRPVAPDGAP